ncbi:hypothetical protein CTI12_AA509970 [Artemisia annua]|uniref:Uncharacterized protein n=1 Tax=Artemisia annua TaxID=35608 RepID=A0A2U1LBH6_ARTAN|nr:hypothetical protein CTI12_AA509970 [Artemisia annua]
MNKGFLNNMSPSKSAGDAHVDVDELNATSTKKVKPVSLAYPSVEQPSMPSVKQPSPTYSSGGLRNPNEEVESTTSTMAAKDANVIHNANASGPTFVLEQPSNQSAPKSHVDGTTGLWSHDDALTGHNVYIGDGGDMASNEHGDTVKTSGFSNVSEPLASLKHTSVATNSDKNTSNVFTTHAAVPTPVDTSFNVAIKSQNFGMTRSEPNGGGNFSSG